MWEKLQPIDSRCTPARLLSLSLLKARSPTHKMIDKTEFGSPNASDDLNRKCSDIYEHEIMRRPSQRGVCLNDTMEGSLVTNGDYLFKLGMQREHHSRKTYMQTKR